jgi:hypothetical protein
MGAGEDMFGNGRLQALPTTGVDRHNSHFLPRSLYALLRIVSHMRRNTTREQTADAKRTQNLEQLTAELDAKRLSIRLGE